jgi:thioredoxin
VDPSRHPDRPKCAECGKPFLIDRPVKVSQEHFDKSVLEAEVPVLVDFYADWCAPCKAMAPMLDDIARDKAGEMLVVKVNTDAAPKVSERYGIKSIPYFARFEKGEVVKTAVGAVGLDGLKALAS